MSVSVARRTGLTGDRLAAHMGGLDGAANYMGGI